MSKNGHTRFVQRSSSSRSRTTTSTKASCVALHILCNARLEWWPPCLQPKLKSTISSNYESQSRKSRVPISLGKPYISFPVWHFSVHLPTMLSERWILLGDVEDSGDILRTCWVQMNGFRDYSYMLPFLCSNTTLANVSNCSTIMQNMSYTKGAFFNCTITITQMNKITDKRSIPLVIIHKARVNIDRYRKT